MVLGLTVELVLLLDGSCCRSWRGERAGGERELIVLQWRREREIEREAAVRGETRMSWRCQPWWPVLLSLELGKTMGSPVCMLFFIYYFSYYFLFCNAVGVCAAAAKAALSSFCSRGVFLILVVGPSQTLLSCLVESIVGAAV